jgi:hypothetical protein
MPKISSRRTPAAVSNRSTRQGVPLLCNDTLDTGQVVIYHASPGSGTGGVLINSKRQGLMPLVTLLLYPLHCEAHR